MPTIWACIGSSESVSVSMAASGDDSTLSAHSSRSSGVKIVV
jgi:hypothetical protein